MRSGRGDRIGDLAGCTAVVTGANSGLGLRTATALAAHGARVVLACRDLERAARAAATMTTAGPPPSTLRLDLADLVSVRAAAEELASCTDGIDVLVNNAGVMAIPRMLTADGFEMQLGTNHLGHFALTAGLWPLLTARPGARVVTVSSLAAHVGAIRFDDLQSEHGYHPWTAYGQAKRANLLFAVELGRVARALGSSVASVAAHPGYASTELVANGPRDTATRSDRALFALLDRVVAQSAAGGARPVLHAATAGGVAGGEYFVPRGPLHVRGRPKRARMPRAARDAATARRLWEVSAELTGADLPTVAGRPLLPGVGPGNGRG